MFVKVKKLFFLLTVYNNCASIAEGSRGPRFHTADGRILENGYVINIMYGTTLELFCTGQSIGDIFKTRCKKEYEPIDIITINHTTVKISQENLEREEYQYYCADSQADRFVIVRVVVDSLPMEINLRCISEDLNYMNCSLTSANYYINSLLYYVQDGVPFRLCNLEYRSTVNRSPYCIWDQKHPFAEYKFYWPTLTFLTSTCNVWGCANKTFVFDHFSVVRVGPPTDLLLLDHSSHSVSLRWTAPRLIYHPYYLYSKVYTIIYRIVYVYSGIHQFQVNKTGHAVPFFEMDFKLPCADTFYEVRMSAKISERVGEEFWSDDAVMPFATDPDPEGTVETDPTCEHRRVKLTPEVMLYELNKFKSDVIIEQRALTEKIRLLKLKGGVN